MDTSDLTAVDPLQRHPFRRRRLRSTPTSIQLLVIAIFFTWSMLATHTEAAFVNFENCLERSRKNSPVLLQFVPLFFDAKYSEDAQHRMTLTVHGNVTGQATGGTYPPADDPRWSDPKDVFGKLPKDSYGNFSTLYEKYEVLTYVPAMNRGTSFCNHVINAECPVPPAFFKNASEPDDLPGFNTSHNFYSSYAFASFQTTLSFTQGDINESIIGCVSAVITPELGIRLENTIRYVPAIILALVAISTIFAATLSPWGSWDPFRWTSNYGRDEDILRLVTPGFGDCLQYIQFIVLTGCLSLNYPGYYQPVVSRASWSTLMFNQSFVSHGDGTQSLIDGIYVANGTYGLTRFRQLVGMTKDQDIWAGMAIWLVAMFLGVTVLFQICFAFRWGHRKISQNPEGDHRNKNLPFSAGNAIRIVYNYFLLPIMTLSLFQLVDAPHSPAYVVALAVFLLLVLLLFAVWIFRMIFMTRPRAHLFDDLPTVLLYGPLYNTYSDHAAPFAFIPVLLTLFRGAAIGAIQPSGIAQLVVLAICEVVLILTIHAFRPFQSQTSMNAYHIFFSSIRLITVLLSITFVPTLGVTEGPKGWVGYVILFLHAIVLVFGFFLNAIQTLIEVAARRAGAGGDSRGGLVKVFGARQLSRRRDRGARSSLNSDAAMLGPEGDNKSINLMSGRTRSMSASSAMILNKQNTPDQRYSGLEQFSQGGEFGAASPEPSGAETPFSYLPSGSTSAGPSSRRATFGLKGVEPTNAYYRPPRARRPTMDALIPTTTRNRNSKNSVETPATPYKDSDDKIEAADAAENSPFSHNRSSIAAAFLRHRDDSNPDLTDRGPTDYTVREVDFYYGISRGPALSNLHTRKLKTGPADPVGPVSAAGGWLRGLFGVNRKEKGKGFEVVRSTRAPPPMMPLDELEASPPPVHQEPYKDSPDPQDVPSPQDENPTNQADPFGLARKVTSESQRHVSPLSSDDEDSFDEESSMQNYRVSDVPPILGEIDTGGALRMPSRIGSKASSRPSRSKPGTLKGTERVPSIPRKSSRRTHSQDAAILTQGNRLSTIAATPTLEPSNNSQWPLTDHLHPSSNMMGRVPFGSAEPSPSPERPSGGPSAASSVYDGALAPPPSQAERERPLSTGYVHQHVAGDNIQPGMYADSHLGTSAEVVYDSEGRSLSTGRSFTTSRANSITPSRTNG
ncbi:hypothetical protein M501DRAFT_930891 [Patellaria atrata CBS 101060]|uniref:ML-like domain-containing protein n=1 Tax=Patellaria atrata CBS 101060 TaxID=1346257 RepID=A0A9P4SDX3_9PEZI|nr:hypothetical protein M501DRAFT_930891 [Patellaria atrata CBS 101060]